MKIIFRDINSLKGRSLKITLLLLSIACLIGLNTAASFAQTFHAIDYLASSRSHTASMMVNGKAEDVWQNVVNVAKMKNPNNLNIKKESKEDLKFEATKITKNGEELWASIKVKPVSETSCRLIFTATMGGNKPLEQDMKEMIVGILMKFCDEKGLTCKIAE